MCPGKSLIGRFSEVPSVWFPIYPEWPEKPFLSVSCEERLARRKRLDPEPNKGSVQATPVDRLFEYSWNIGTVRRS